MQDPEEIKKKTEVASKNMTPEKAAKDLSELKQEELENIAGGKAIAYGDTWQP
jgi:hypothetical protein